MTCVCTGQPRTQHDDDALRCGRGGARELLSVGKFIWRTHAAEESKMEMAGPAASVLNVVEVAGICHTLPCRLIGNALPSHAFDGHHK